MGVLKIKFLEANKKLKQQNTLVFEDLNKEKSNFRDPPYIMKPSYNFSSTVFKSV
jgi:hypothetical protein